MGFLSNQSITIRVAFLSILPLLALVAVGANKLVREHNRATNANTIAHVIKMAPVISGLAHQLQKERGTSAGFVSSRGNKFASAKMRSQAETDQALQLLRKTRLDTSAYSKMPGFLHSYDKVKRALDELTTKRQEIAGLDISVAETAQYYTPIINNLLSMVQSLGKIAEHKEILRSMTAFTAVLWGKEKAGLERAMGAAGFGTGTFKPEIYRKFIRFGAMQRTYFTTFLQYANKHQRAMLRSAISPDTHVSYENMRQLALNAPFGGDISSVIGARWFKVTSERIEELKKVEDEIDLHIVKRALSIAQEASRAFWIMAASVFGILAFTIIVSVIIARSISRPIGQLTSNMGLLSQNEKSTPPQGQERRDEIGKMARAVEVFRQNAIKAELQEAEQLASEQRAEQEKAAVRLKLADDFDATVGAIVGTVSSASAQLQSTARSMAEISEQTSSQAHSVSIASQQASNNVQTVAAATEEMTNTIKEISQQVEQASNVSRQAVEEVNQTGTRMETLTQNANAISQVIDMISDIAEQTNLLALNATIESARAGEAGRGFAVVASEVKQLASQTTKATSHIATQIGDMQSASRQVSASMAEVGRTIERVDEISTAIAAAMEEQSAATAEIASNVHQAASGTRMVNDNISSVTLASQEAGTASGEVMSAAGELSQQSELLRNEVDRFITQVRAG